MPQCKKDSQTQTNITSEAGTSVIFVSDFAEAEGVKS